MYSLRVDARDVLDANTRVVRTFAARVRGRFHRLGPNAWDDYELVWAPADVHRLGPGLRVQLEAEGALVRTRYRGEVLLVAWIPSQDEAAALADADEEVRRRYFVERYLTMEGEAPGLGAAAVIARKLDEE